MSAMKLLNSNKHQSSSSFSKNFKTSTSSLASSPMSGIFIVAAKRTPFGKFGGSLKKKTITDLSEIALKAALTQAGLLGLCKISLHCCHFVVS